MALHFPLVLSSVAIGVALFLYNVIQWLAATRRPQNYPPGPPTLLGLGNLHLVPQSLPFLKYDQWAKEYGPIVGLKFGSTNVVVLNDASLVYEFIVKRGAYFAARPPRYIAQEHVLPDARHTYSLFMRNDYSRRLRTVTKQFLVGAGLSELAPMQQAAGTRLIFNLLESGTEWLEQIMQWYTPFSASSGSPFYLVDDTYMGCYRGVSTPIAMLSGAAIQGSEKPGYTTTTFRRT